MVIVEAKKGRCNYHLVHKRCNRRLKGNSQKYCPNHVASPNTGLRNSLRTRRQTNELLEHYGAYCSCCGEEEIKFLTFDHINGGGEKDRARFSGHARYIKFLFDERPTSIQILCFNCNMGRERNSDRVCPHKD